MQFTPQALPLEKNKAITPFLRWAGSKRKLLPKLIPYWGTGYVRYIEPFTGSGALFFALQPKDALLIDVNKHLIEALRVVRDKPSDVHAQLSAMETSKSSYYKLRSRDPGGMTKMDRAVRFIFLNRFCFNGLYRTNMAGGFNVPYAASRTGGIPPLETFVQTAAMLRCASLRASDFETVLRKEVRAGDFVYLDPPYAVGNRRIFRQYGPQTFGLEDLARLKRVLTEVNARGAHFLLSYACCKEVKEYFGEWKQRRVYTQRNIAGFSRHRRRAAETIVSNIEIE